MLTSFILLFFPHATSNLTNRLSKCKANFFSGLFYVLIRRVYCLFVRSFSGKLRWGIFCVIRFVSFRGARTLFMGTHRKEIWLIPSICLKWKRNMIFFWLLFLCAERLPRDIWPDVDVAKSYLLTIRFKYI